jgi:dTDP-glucose 4,6-dehydratase
LQTNILGTEVLSRLAVKHGIKRFHHVSTDEVFGTLELDSHERFNEDTPYDPRSPYSASKASSDHIVRAYGETYGLPFTITNCSNNYGPWDSPGRAVPVFITRILSGETIPLYGKGDFVRDYLYVQDHVNAIDSAIHQGRIMQTYTVGGGAEKTGVELATAILEAMGESTDRIEFVEDRPGHDSRYAINPAKITRELGWKQSVTFEEGIQNTVAWYKTNEEWWRPYKDKLSLLRDSANYKQAKGKRVGRDR